MASSRSPVQPPSLTLYLGGCVNEKRARGRNRVHHPTLRVLTAWQSSLWTGGLKTQLPGGKTPGPRPSLRVVWTVGPPEETSRYRSTKSYFWRSGESTKVGWGYDYIFSNIHNFMVFKVHKINEWENNNLVSPAPHQRSLRTFGRFPESRGAPKKCERKTTVPGVFDHQLSRESSTWKRIKSCSTRLDSTLVKRVPELFIHILVFGFLNIF